MNGVETVGDDGDLAGFRSAVEEEDGGGVVPGVPRPGVVVIDIAEVAVVVRAGSAELVGLHGDAASTASSCGSSSPNAVTERGEGERGNWRRRD